MKRPLTHRRLSGEELEPRQLLSADFVPVAVEPAPLPQSPLQQAVVATLVTQSTAAQYSGAVELVFVDPRVPDRESLLADLQASGRRFEIITLDASRDGIVQVTEALADRIQVDAVHFITHGTDGAVQLGGSWLNAKTLAANAEAVASWGHALKEDGDLLFYGCDLAGSASGRALLDWIAELTQADVAASADKTGAEALGGNWTLDYHLGQIDAQIAVSKAEQRAWNNLLATYAVTLATDANAAGGGDVGDLRWAITQANANAGADTIAFNIAGAGPHTITLAALLPNVTGQLTLDGWSEPDYTGANPVIVLDGNDLLGSGLTLTGTADGSIIRGLVIRNFGSNSADDAGIQIQSGSNDNVIVGNYIGRLNADGTTAAVGLENTGKGIFIDGGSNNRIGGTTAAERNIIAGTGDDGIALDNNANGNIIQGNWIGQNGAGAVLGVGDDGIEIQGGSSNNWIGGTTAGAGNVIRASGDSGIELRSAGTDGNRILGNSIYETANDAGIDIDTPNGAPNPNDDGDADAQSNQGQNYPFITSAVRTANAVRVAGEFSAAQLNRTAPNTTFRIELFANSSISGSGLYEGERYLGFFDVTTDATGSATFDVTFMAAVALNERITATATDPSGNTSEFFYVAGGRAATAAAGSTISGTIWEDVDGDADISLADGTVGAAGVTVHLWRDVFGTPAYVASAVTNASGQYSFIGIADGTYGVVVDSKTIAPSAGFNAGFGQGDVWAEQTYGAADGVYFTGSLPVDPSDFSYLPIAGALYGGVQSPVGGTSDDLSDVMNAEHLTRVVVSGASVSGVDSGFSFNVVTNTLAGDNQDDDASSARTVQGSLRQFIQNANAIAGANSMRFVPVEATNASGGGGNWWTIDVTNALPTISDGGTTIDGTAYSSADGVTVVDPNAGQVGSGGTVGVGALTLDRVDRPELELSGGNSFTGPGLRVAAGNATIRDIAINGFGNTMDSSQIQVDATVTAAAGQAVISGNLVGTNADGTNPGTSELVGILTNGAASITNNYIAYIENNAVMMSLAWLGTPNVEQVNVINNEIAFNQFTPGFTGDLLSDVPSNAVIRGNYIHDFQGAVTADVRQGKGIEIWYQTQNALIEDNTIENMRVAGIGINDGSSGNVLRRNIITGTTGVSGSGGAGILITSFNDTAAAPPNDNRITENSIYSNAGLGIDLDARGPAFSAAYVGDGVTANDANDPDSGANDLQNFPTATAFSWDGANFGVTNLDVDGPAFTNYRVEFFANTANDREGQRYLGSYNLSSGMVLTGTIAGIGAVNPGEYITMTATRTNGAGTVFYDSSEFSAPVLATVTGSTYSISGTVYHDVDGDAVVAEGGTLAFSGATVRLFQDDGDGVINAADSFVTFATTDASGNYSFTGLADATYWLAVDSTTLTSGAAFNPTYDASWIWAEQTYGVAGAAQGAGFLGASGALYGGKNDWASDNAAAIASAEHVSRVTVSGANVTGVDSGFSFNAVTSWRDGDDVGGNRTVQGSLRQFILNSNAITNASYGIQSSDFSIGSGAVTIAPTSALPTITDATILDATTQNGFAGTPLVELSGASVGAANGITIDAGGSTVRGFVINRFAQDGIRLNTSGGNTIAGNWIGLDNTGATSAGFGNQNGIRVNSGSTNNVIGGTNAADRNVIAGSVQAGATLTTGNGILLNGGSGNQILGNYIGTDKNGTLDRANDRFGIYVLDSANNIIGGAAAGARNIVAGAHDEQIRLSGTGSTGNQIRGNYIGTGATGTESLGAASDGVLFYNGARDNVVGGTAAGEGNLIVNNGWGVSALNDTGIAANDNIRNTIRGNAIYSNVTQAIELDDPGYTGYDANDLGDADSGSNFHQNYPVLDSAVVSGGSVTISGHFNNTDASRTRANSTYAVDFYANPAAATGREGRTYLGSVTVTTNASGDAAFTSLPLAFTGYAAGDRITATATMTSTTGGFGAEIGSTSEFSASLVTTAAPNSPPVNTVPGAQVVNEDTALAIAGVSVSDPDGDLATTQLSVTNGTLTVNLAGGATISAGGNGTSTLTLSGTQAQINAALATLSYQGNADFNGADTLTVLSTDSNSATDSDTVAITVNPVNDAPILNAAQTPVLGSIAQGSGAPSGAVGTLVSSLVDFASPAGQVDNVTDVDSGALLGIALTAADTTNGTWWYSTDGGTNWFALGAVTDANARLLAADANTRIYFQPNPAFSGTIATAITFRAWDQTSGANGALGDASTNGGTTAFSTATDTAAITVTAAGTTANDDAGSTNEDSVLSVPAPGVLTNDTLTPPAVTAGAWLNYDAANDLDGTGNTTWADDTARAGWDWTFVANATPVVPTTGYAGITNAYGFPVSGAGTTGQTFQGSGASGLGDTEDATFELWFKPSDVTDQDVLFESGGATTGISLILRNADGDGLFDDLAFSVTNAGVSDFVTADLSSILGDPGDGSVITSEFIQVVAVHNRDGSGANDILTLYVNGSLVGSVSNQIALNDWSGSGAAGLGGRNTGINATAVPGFDAVTANYTPFEGEIALFRFYDNNAFDPAAVATNFAAVAQVLTVTEVNGVGADVGNPVLLPSGALVTVNADGSYTYDPNGSFESLAAGDSTIDTFTYTSADFLGASDSATVTITINGVNDAPVLNVAQTPVLSSVAMNSPAPSGAVGTLVSALVDFASPAGQVDNVTDVDAGALLGIAVTAADTTNGTWWYSTDGGTNWFALGAVTDANARLLAADANTRIYFQPNPAFSGTIANAIAFRAWDRTSGANGDGGVDTTTNGGTTAFSTATDTAAITVTAASANVNFTISSTPSISEDLAETATFTVALGGDPLTGGNAASVDITASGTALSGTDYSNFVAAIAAAAGATPGVTFDGVDTLTFDSTFNGGTGTGAFAFTVTAIDDPSVEGTETIIATLSNPSVVSGSATLGTTGSFNVQISQNSDDSEETISSGSIDWTSTDLELGEQTGGVPASAQIVGVRFQNLTIPQGATITNAYIQFTVDETDSIATNLTFSGELAANPATFQNVAFDLSGRIVNSTAASVAWNNVPVWGTVGAAGADQQTPNLSPIIQEIVNQGAWASGNALVIFVTGTGERTAESYNGSPAQAPVLFVEYTTGASSATTNITEAEDGVPPVVNDQAFGYPENQLAGATVATLAFSDNVAVTGFTFTATGTNLSSDGFYQISNAGVITLTAAGAAAAANDFETAPNSFVHNVTAVDAAGNADTANITLNVTDLGEVPPVVTTSGGALAYTENDPFSAVDPAVTVTDIDNLTLPSVTVQITAGYVAGEDLLTFTATGGITGSFDAGTGTLTLTGPATIADWQTVLQSVAYRNTSDDPSTAPRTVTMIANDGTSNSAPSIRTINITAVNDAPAVTANNLTISDGASVVFSAANLGASDPDNASGTLSYTASGIANGQFELAGAPGVAVTTFTAAQLAGGQVVFVHAGNNTAPTYTVTASDGTLPSAPSAAAVTFNGAGGNPAPNPDPGVLPPPPPGGGGDEGGGTTVTPPGDSPGGDTGSSGDDDTGGDPAPLDAPAPVSRSGGETAEIIAAPEAPPLVAAPEARVATAEPKPPVVEPQSMTVFSDGLTVVQSQQGFDPTFVQVRKAPEITVELGKISLPDPSGDRLIQIDLDSIRMTGLALSIGAIWWATRAAGLLASLLSSLPAWSSFDPLPVLARDKDEEEDDEWGRAEDTDEKKEAEEEERALARTLAPRELGDEPDEDRT